MEPQTSVDRTNEHWREQKEKLQKKYDTLEKEKYILELRVKGLNEQKKQIQKKCKQINAAICDLHNKNEQNCLSQTAHKAQFQTAQQHTNQMQQNKELEKKKEECKMLKEEIKLLYKLEEKDKHLLQKYEQLLTKDKELQELRYELATVNERYLSDIQMLHLSGALNMFEKNNIRIIDTHRRGDEWAGYFREKKTARECLREVGFRGDVKSTVLSLFNKLNAGVHGDTIGNSVVIYEDDFTPEEVKLVQAVWRHYPLREGTLYTIPRTTILCLKSHK